MVGGTEDGAEGFGLLKGELLEEFLIKVGGCSDIVPHGVGTQDKGGYKI